jgi:hypothetical protein
VSQSSDVVPLRLFFVGRQHTLVTVVGNEGSADHLAEGVGRGGDKARSASVHIITIIKKTTSRSVSSAKVPPSTRLLGPWQRESPRHRWLAEADLRRWTAYVAAGCVMYGVSACVLDQRDGGSESRPESARRTDAEQAALNPACPSLGPISVQSSLWCCRSIGRP